MPKQLATCFSQMLMKAYQLPGCAEEDRALCRLEELNDRRQGFVQRVKIVEKEREALEGPRAAAELFKAKEAEVNVAKSALFQYFIRQGKVWFEFNV